MSERARVVDALERLSDADLDEVSRLIDSLRGRRGAPQAGSVEAVRRAVGSWWMTSDETAQFLSEVERLRHIEGAAGALPPEY